MLIKNETYKKVKDYSKNKSDLNAYFEVGRLIVEAQGGEARAKYGNKLINDFSWRLTKELGEGYSTRNLKYMRKFYLFVQKGHALHAQLSWNHYKLLLSISDAKEINYYIYISESQNLGYRELQKRIKSNEYQRIGYKEELDDPKVNTLIKNPIIIKTKNNIGEEISEKLLHQLILEDISSFLKELGVGFCFIDYEYRIRIAGKYHYIDFLLFNVKFNCYVVIEIKVTEMRPQYIGQVMKYINYVDKNIKELHNNNTIGVVICRRDNKYVMEYCTDDRIFTTTYELQNN